MLCSSFSNSALFDAYIALGASAWIADGVLLEDAATYFEHPADADAFVYMAAVLLFPQAVILQKCLNKAHQRALRGFLISPGHFFVHPVNIPCQHYKEVMQIRSLK